MVFFLSLKTQHARAGLYYGVHISCLAQPTLSFTTTNMSTYCPKYMQIHSFLSKNRKHEQMQNSVVRRNVTEASQSRHLQVFILVILVYLNFKKINHYH